MKKHIAIVEDEYLIEHLDIFSNESCRIVRTFVEDEVFKDDLEHKRLMKAKKKANDEYYNYEFNVRHNHK